jgi:hypothetical protein
VIQSAPLIETLAGLALIGVAGVIRWRHRGRHHRTGRRVRRPPPLFRVRWLPVPIAVAGLALLADAWVGEQAAPPKDSGPAAQADAPAPMNGAKSRRGVLLLRGTPADDDSASDESVKDYSLRLGGLIADALSRPPASIALDTEPLASDQWKELREDPGGARRWCRDDGSVDFVAAIGIPALRLPDGVGYAPWREPEELLLACANDARSSQRGRVNERLGDRVPYEQALADELRSALGRIGIGIGATR